MPLFSDLSRFYKKKRTSFLPFSRTQSQPSFLEKVERWMGRTPRTSNLFGRGGDVHVTPMYKWPLDTLYDLSYRSDVLTTVQSALRREVFRNGLELTEADLSNDDNSQSEQAESPISPEDERKEILEFVEKINKNGQSLLQVCGELEDDLNIMDDAYMRLGFEYEFTEAGELFTKRLREVTRCDPRSMGLVMNSQDDPGTDDQGRKLYFDPRDRTKLVFYDECSDGLKNFPAHFHFSYAGKKMYYAPWEIIHVQKYRPSKRFGYPPVLTVWQKVRTLMGIDEWFMETYDGQRAPQSVVFMRTSNIVGAQEAMEQMMLRMEEHPNWPPFAIIPDEVGGKGDFVKNLEVMPSPADLQTLEMRNENRSVIGGVYGVMPVFQADVSASGGLNNEGFQVTVTNRAVEHGQSIYNTLIFPKILEGIGHSGWVLRLNPSEEQDEMAQLTRQQVALSNADAASRLGLDVEWDDESGTAIIKSGSVVPAPASPFGFDTGPKPPGPPSPETPGSSGQPKKPFTASAAKKKTREPFTKLSSIIHNTVSSFIRRIGSKPGEKELRKLMADLNTEFTKGVKSKVDGFLKQHYMGEIERTEKELDINFTFDTTDQRMMEVLQNQQVLSQAYAGLTQELSQKVNSVIYDAYRTPNGLNIREITERIKDAVNVADSRAENIARTETSKVSAAARRTAYLKADPEGTFKYRWIGPDDNRTTGTSKRIKARVGDGVSWKDLVRIVQEESKKDFPEWTVDKDFPVSHYQSRHVFVRTNAS